jgi:hypothetical protein
MVDSVTSAIAAALKLPKYTTRAVITLEAGHPPMVDVTYLILPTEDWPEIRQELQRFKLVPIDEEKRNEKPD